MTKAKIIKSYNEFKKCVKRAKTSKRMIDHENVFFYVCEMLDALKDIGLYDDFNTKIFKGELNNCNREIQMKIADQDKIKEYISAI